MRASPVQPFCSRWGQSVGTLWKLVRVGPPGGLVDAAEHLVTALERAHGFQIGVDHPALEGQDLGRSLHPHVAEAVVAEVGAQVRAPALQDVAVVVGEVLAAEAVDVLGVEGAVGVQALAVEQVHLVPGLPLDGDLRPAAGVLPQIVDAGEDLLGRQGADHADGGDLHGLEHPAGGAAHKGLLPGGIVEAGAVPAGLLQAGVPHLAAAHVVEGDGPAAVRQPGPETRVSRSPPSYSRSSWARSLGWWRQGAFS